MTTFKRSSLAAALAALTFGLSASADNGKEDNFRARLSGYNEVHFIAAPTPALRGAVSTQASGSFRAEIDDRHDAIDYTLTYSDHMHGYHLTTGETITHVDEAGYTVWSTDLGGDVESHADLGEWQVASLRSDSSSSRLVVVDSETGEVVSEQRVDRPAGTVYGSDDDRTVVVATDMASDAYSLR